MVPLLRMECQPYRHRQGILVHGAGRKNSGYDVCLLSLSLSHVGPLKLTPLLRLCLCPWNLIPPPASLQCSEDHVSVEQSDWSLWAAMGATEICQLLALFLLIWVFSVITMEMPLGNLMGLKKPPRSVPPSPTHRVVVGLFFFELLQFLTTRTSKIVSVICGLQTLIRIYREENPPPIPNSCVFSHLVRGIYVHSFICHGD